MNFFSYKENFFRSKQVSGIEYNFLPDGEIIINAVILKENKSKVEIVSSHELKSIIEIKNVLPKNIPIFLVVTGKGIIHKKIHGRESENDKSTLHEILPNADIKDFYIEKHVNDNLSNESNLFVSVIRKNILDDLINEFLNNEYHIIGCTLGPFCIQSIFPLIDEPERDSIQINNYLFSIKDNNIDNYRVTNAPPDNPTINISGNTIHQMFGIAFAASFQYFISGEKRFLLKTNSIFKEQNEFKQKMIFEKAGWMLIIIFLIVLLANFFIFQNYSSKNAELNTRLSFLQYDLENYKSIENDFKNKQEFLKRNGLLELSKTSFYADEISGDLPAEILLTSLNIFPASKNTGHEEEKLIFKPKVVTVSGQCNLSTELNDWMQVLKKKKWISKVSVLDYHQDNLKTRGQFTIEIAIN